MYFTNYYILYIIYYGLFGIYRTEMLGHWELEPAVSEQVIS
jgi:hypothetical protein